MSTDPRTLFSDTAREYALYRPRYPRALFEYLFDRCPDLDRAWDCATGSGQAAVALAERFAEIEATDASPEQIRNAEPHERVRYSLQPAESTNFPDRHFSLVTVAQALHWFDLEAFWPEVQRVLKPRGVFAAWTYTWPQVTESIDRIVTTRLLEIIANYWLPHNRLVMEGYASIELPFHELPPPSITLQQNWTLQQFLAYVETWSATRRAVDELGDEFLTELSEELQDAWGDQNREVTMDFYCRTGRHET